MEFEVEILKVPKYDNIDNYLDYKNNMQKDNSLPVWQKAILHHLANIEIEKLER